MAKKISGVSGNWIILFFSVHHALAAEKAFKKRSVWYDMVPVPRILSSDCAMGIEFKSEDIDKVKNVLAGKRVNPSFIYEPDGVNYIDRTSDFN